MTAKTITVEQFTKDLWEAQREDIRRNLFRRSDDDLEAHFPAWGSDGAQPERFGSKRSLNISCSRYTSRV